MLKVPFFQTIEKGDEHRGRVEIVASFGTQFVETTPHPDGSKQVNNFTADNAAQLVNTQVIGDFDGDGNEEIYLVWVLSMMGPSYLINSPGDTTSSGTNSNSSEQYGVFSLKKNSYIIKSTFDIKSFPSWPSNVKTGDLNGDGCIDYIIGDKIYTTSTPIKKNTNNP